MVPELGLGRAGLGEEDGAGEEYDADEEKEDEKAELAHAGAYRLAEDLQSLGVTRQLEDAKHAHQPNDPQYRQRRRLDDRHTDHTQLTQRRGLD